MLFLDLFLFLEDMKYYFYDGMSYYDWFILEEGIGFYFLMGEVLKFWWSMWD